MKKIINYFKFNIWGLIIFLIIMVPNFIWMVIPSVNDVLRKESITGINDIIMSSFQVIMIILLCFTLKKIDNNKKSIISIMMIVLYYLCWILYYCGIINNIIILGLCLFPCFSFIFYEIKTKNWLAFIPTIGFSITHLIFSIVNFL